MQISTAGQANESIMALTGSITFSTRKTLRTTIEKALADGQREFVLDLHDVTFIDSSGLGALVACFSSVRKQGGSMKLRRVPRIVYELMEMTKLTQFFDISDT